MNDYRKIVEVFHSYQSDCSISYFIQISYNVRNKQNVRNASAIQPLYKLWLNMCASQNENFTSVCNYLLQMHTVRNRSAITL